MNVADIVNVVDVVNLFEAVFLGIVQGLTEWLPISSSGHLVIAQQAFGMQVPLFFDIMLHAGTLFALFAFFWKDILKILQAIVRLDFKSGDGKLGLFILIGSIPIALAGFFLYDLITPLFNSLVAVGSALIITGSILYFTKIFRGRVEKRLNSKNAFFVGIVQAFSLLPGISRSGITISSALFRKINRQQAFVFSFLLAIPAIIGASVFELYRATVNLNLAAIGFEMVAGAVIAAVVGYLSLKFLWGILNKGKFYFFAYYCWIVGMVALIYAYF